MTTMRPVDESLPIFSFQCYVKRIPSLFSRKI